MNHHKNIGLLLLTLFLGIPLNSYADPVSRDQAIFDAQAQVKGTAKILMNVFLRTVADPSSPDETTSISWSDVFTNGPTPVSWKIADTFIVVESTLTAYNAGIQVFTDNTTIASNPRWFDLTPKPASAPNPTDPDYVKKMQEYISKANNPDSNPAGLVMDVPGVTFFTIPLAWTAKTEKKVVGQTLLPSDPVKGRSDPDAGAASRFQWISLADKKTPAIDWNLDLVLNAPTDPITPQSDRDGDGQIDDSPEFSAGADAHTVLDAAKGVHVSQGPGFNGAGAGARTTYIYLEGNFENAFAPAPPATVLNYKTNRFIVELFTE